MLATARRQTISRAINRLLLAGPAKPVLVVLLLAPLLDLLVAAAHDRLGANPAEALIRGTGDWTLRLLWLTLSVTPLRQLSGWTALARFRRMLGLSTFGYAFVHFLCFAWLDMGLDPVAIVRDIGQRPFILVGSLALLLLLPLAATSFDGAMRALGAARWRALHRSVYAVAVLVLLHFFWMRASKNDLTEVAVYATILALLLAWRWHRRRSG